MARIFDYAPNGSYAFDWNAQPELNDPAYESPVPCYSGYNCCYTSVCSFVHPGEEGVGRRIFEARSAEEKDVVRIFGKPHKKATFYERRRLRMSWPAWCAKMGWAAPVAPPKPAVSAVEPIPAGTHRRKQVVDLRPSTVAPAPAKAAPADGWELPVPGVVPSKTLQQAFLEAAHMAAQNQMPFGLANWAIYEQVLYQLPKAPFVSMSFRQSYGELLFGQVAWALEEQREMLRAEGVLTTKTTAGKIVGMFLDAYSEEELGQLYQDKAQLIDAIAEAVVMLHSTSSA